MTAVSAYHKYEFSLLMCNGFSKYYLKTKCNCSFHEKLNNYRSKTSVKLTFHYFSIYYSKVILCRYST